MLRNILKLEGAQPIDKAQQKEISGGGLTISTCFGPLACQTDADCHNGCPCTRRPNSLCGYCLSARD